MPKGGIGLSDSFYQQEIPPKWEVFLWLIGKVDIFVMSRERAEQFFWVHNRGVRVALPPESTSKISKASILGQGVPEEEVQRLKVITHDPILRKRYPADSDGQEYMQSVCANWRNELLSRAQSISCEIAHQAESMRKRPTAIILFGSVARALTKYKGHEDPSNIDLAVIGHFNDSERTELFDRIRPVRESMAGEIGNNVGVIVQDVQAVRNNDFDSALIYIGSSATALWDPEGLWAQIEKDALERSKLLRRYKKQDQAKLQPLIKL